MRVAVLRPAVGVGGCALLVACASGHRVQPPTPSPTSTGCVVTTAQPGSTPPPIIHPTEPQPVPWIADFVGNQTLWVSLPADSTLHSDIPSAHPITVKFPWWRMKPGQLRITAERLDGPGAGFNADAGTVSDMVTAASSPPD